MNRLTNLASDRLLTAIARYVYTVGPTGNRTTAAEQLFTSALNAHAVTIDRVYQYDATYRLTNETVNGTSTAGYHYDPVGNRLARSGSGVPGLTYTIEVASSLVGPWTKLANQTAPNTDVGLGLGGFEIRESMGSNTTRFYRTIYPSY